MSRILIVGKGGYGDLFPLFAIAEKLKAANHRVTIAAEGHHAPAAASIGVQLVELDAADPAGSIQTEIFRTLAPASIEREYECIVDEVRASDLVIGNHLSYSGSIAAKKVNKPWIFCAPSPLAILSRQDPPVFPYLHGVQSISHHFGFSQIPFIDLARFTSQLMMHSNTRLQKRLGVFDRTHPRFEGMYSQVLNLIPVSPTLLSPQTDWPTNTVTTGFSWFEPSFMGNEQELKRIADFFDAGTRPIIIAPGGSRRVRPGNFYRDCIDACRKIGHRAIVIASKRFHGKLPTSRDIFVSGYLPYSILFKRCAAVIHSGGIGTIGWGLKYALPSLLVPSEWDQFDNANRVGNKKLAAVIAGGKYNVAQIASTLENLLNDEALRDRLQQTAAIVEKEDGAEVARLKIEAELENL